MASTQITDFALRRLGHSEEAMRLIDFGNLSIGDGQNRPAVEAELPLAFQRAIYVSERPKTPVQTAESATSQNIVQEATEPSPSPIGIQEAPTVANQADGGPTSNVSEVLIEVVETVQVAENATPDVVDNRKQVVGKGTGIGNSFCQVCLLFSFHCTHG